MPARESCEALDPKMLGAALDALASGVVLTTRDGRVLFMNSAASQQTRTSGALCLSNNRFVPNDPKAARIFARALSGSESDRIGEAPHGHTLALPSRDGPGIFATILRLQIETADAAAPRGGTTAIFIQDPSALRPCPGEAFARLYGLTRCELRVALSLMRCCTLRDVAMTLGVALQTVKTHLQHIFQKTNTSRQADLLALMWRASSPARLA
jgi:DNA-binding CsgD family transcriptional regulator